MTTPGLGLPAAAFLAGAFREGDTPVCSALAAIRRSASSSVSVAGSVPLGRVALTLPAFT